MPIELKVPEAGESVTEIEIGDWLKNKGDHIERDEPIVTLESDKATVDLPSPVSGTLTEVLKQKGQTAKVGEVIAYLEQNGGAEKPQPKGKEAGKSAEETPKGEPQPEVKEKAELEKPELRSAPKQRESAKPKIISSAEPKTESKPKPSEKGEAPSETKKHDTENVTSALEKSDDPLPENGADKIDHSDQSNHQEEIVPMSRLRRTVAERLVEAQHNAALLTTFNEIDMTAVLALRKEHGEAFKKKYNAKLGIMSFFVKASIDALKQFPVLNAEVRENDIVYHNYFDIGIAIGGGKGLVVPVLHNAERMSFAEIEAAISNFASRAKENKLTIEELRGGTFTITNGGIYGSLLSTPIVNPPQSGILGLHAIQERPVARDGNVVIRSMMFAALTYDHRIVDGREAVGCLKRIKDVIENPSRMLIEI